jgi:hypothetical protein
MRKWLCVHVCVSARMCAHVCMLTMAVLLITAFCSLYHPDTRVGFMIPSSFVSLYTDASVWWESVKLEVSMRNKLSSCRLTIVICIILHLHNNCSFCMLYSDVKYVQIFCKNVNYNLPQSKLADMVMLLTCTQQLYWCSNFICDWQALLRSFKFSLVCPGYYSRISIEIRL